MAVLELSLCSGLALNSEFTCLCLLGAGIKGMCHGHHLAYIKLFKDQNPNATDMSLSCPRSFLWELDVLRTGQLPSPVGQAQRREGVNTSWLRLSHQVPGTLYSCSSLFHTSRFRVSAFCPLFTAVTLKVCLSFVFYDGRKE